MRPNRAEFCITHPSLGPCDPQRSARVEVASCAKRSPEGGGRRGGRCSTAPPHKGLAPNPMHHHTESIRVAQPGMGLRQVRQVR